MKPIIYSFFVVVALLFQGCATSLYSVDETSYDLGSDEYIVDLLNDTTSAENFRDNYIYD